MACHKNNGFRKITVCGKNKEKNKIFLSIPKSFRSFRVNEIQHSLRQKRPRNRIPFLRESNSLVSPKPVDYCYLIVM